MPWFRRPTACCSKPEQTPSTSSFGRWLNTCAIAARTRCGRTTRVACGVCSSAERHRRRSRCTSTASATAGTTNGWRSRSDGPCAEARYYRLTPLPLHMQRRDFIRQSALAAVAAALPPQLITDPYAPLARLARRSGVVRVRGRVVSDGRGIPGVSVSDGLSVVATERDGRFTLIADRSQPFVFMTTPAGYETPTSTTGTAAFYKRIAADTRDEMQGVDFSLARAGRDDANHAFLVLADTQTQNPFEMGRLHAETVPDVAATIAALGDQPVFGVACGDIMYDDLTMYPEYERAVRGMGAPFYQVVGNHDILFNVASDEASAATFERHFGPTYYSFDCGEVHYVVLDDVFWHGMGYLGYVGEPQQRWLTADLARVERGRTVIVALRSEERRVGKEGRSRGSPDR